MDETMDSGGAMAGNMTSHMGNGESMTLFLFDPAEATHVAVSSGSWTDPSTWKDGKVPGTDAKVYVPEGIEVEYNSTSNARLEMVRVDGALDFATSIDTHMRVETLLTGVNSRLTIGTNDNPVDANVTTKIVFADGPIDLNVDPGQLSHGLIAEGQVEIVGAEKAPYSAMIGEAQAGAKSIVVADGDGWAVGDDVVVMGTTLGKFQDEERKVVAVEQTSAGLKLTFDKALTYDHTVPDGHDLSVYVGNSSRNVVLTSENPEGVRGHVMMMHTPDVEVRYAEFDELGRTDKSLPLDENGNVASRYSLHLHETGTEAGADMAILYGNSVHGSPGWGIVQHSSAAAVDFNFVYDIQGAGIVSEDGDETGQWIGNFVTGVYGDGSKFSIQRDELEADFGHAGVAYENQARQITQQDNIAANSNFGWTFRGAETSVDNPDRDALAYDPAPLKGVLNNEEPAIIDFNDNTAIAVGTVIDTGHRQEISITTDLRSNINGLTAWEVDRVFDIFSYTGEYVIKDGLFIGAAAGAGRAIRMPTKHESTSIIDTHFENFRVAISDVGLNHEGVYVGNTFTNIGDKVESTFYGEERLWSHSDINPVSRVKLEIDASSDLTMGPRDHEITITGTITDSAGQLRLGSNKWGDKDAHEREGITTDDNMMGHPTPEDLLAVHGALQVDGGWVMPIAIWITDRVTGEHFAFRIDIDLVGYTNEFLSQYEISEFVMPDGDLNIIDSSIGSGSGQSGGGSGTGTGGGTGVVDPGEGGTDTGEVVDPDTGGTDPDDGGTDPDNGGTDPGTGGTDPDTGETEPEEGGTDPEEGNGGSEPVDPPVTPPSGSEYGSSLFFDTKGVDVGPVKLDGDFTIESWVKLAEGKNINAADAIVGGPNFDISFHNGTLSVMSGSIEIASASVPAVDGVWAHYAVVREAGDVKIYVDGQLSGQSSGKWTDSISVDTLGDGLSMSRGLMGALDEVRMWDEARSPSEITSNMYHSMDASEVDGLSTAYSFDDGQSMGNDTTSVSDSIVFVGDPVEETGPFLEVGSVTAAQTTADGWMHVSFSSQIENATVVMGPVSFGFEKPAFAAVRNVTSEGFEFQIEEWAYQDGTHGEETISWMAMSEGTYTLGDGRQITAGTMDTDLQGQTSLNLNGMGSDVSVFSQVLTQNSGTPVVARMDDKGNGVYDIALQSEEAVSANWSPEQLSYIAIQEGGDAASGLIAGSTSGIGSKVTSVYGDTELDAEAFFATMASTNGNDTSTMRLSSLGNGVADIFVQEEQSRDSEVRHVGEDVDWMFADTGTFDLF